jgi:hypothetical protein
MSEHDMAKRAIIGATYWLDCSPHEHTAEDALAMARFVRMISDRVWRPIETMPTDGTRCLVTDGAHVEIRSQRKGRHAGPSRGGQPTSGYGISWDHYTRPTHWMPLPVPDRD